jgi:hemolysin activation/secretion protein
MMNNDADFRFLPIVGLGFILCAGSGLAVAETPSAGSLQQQLEPSAGSAVDSANSASLENLLQPEVPADLPSTRAFMVNEISIVGNVSFTKETLHALVADAEGSEFTLVELDQIVQRITSYYRDQGYSLNRAIIPAQEISEGRVTIAVVEANFGQVGLVNNSLVSDKLLKNTIAPIQAGEVIADANLYSSLLLLSDIPGLVVQSTLVPGDEVGHSDLQLQTSDAASVTGSITADQHGNKYTGQEQVVGSVNMNNLAGHGDVLSLNGMLTSGDLKYGRVGYDWLLNGKGSHIGASYSGVNYALGKDLTSIEAHGTSRVASAWFKQPLLRSLTANINGQLQYEDSQLKDHVDSSDSRTDRTLKHWSLTLSGDAKDVFVSGGSSSWSVAITSGRLVFDDATAQTTDAAAGQTQRRFGKLNVTLSHVQALSAKDSVFVSITGQKADGNLDSLQKMGVGGASSVRGYKGGAVSGDSGYFGSIQWNHQLGTRLGGSVTGSVYYDSASVTINHTPWVGLTSDNKATLSGAGVGLSWANAKQVSVSLNVAGPVGPSSSLVTDAPEMRLWLQVSKSF